MQKELDKIKLGFSSVVIFRNILKTKVIKKLLKFLNCKTKENIDNIKQIDLYSEFLSELFKSDNNLADFILSQIFLDDNIFSIVQYKHIVIIKYSVSFFVDIFYMLKIYFIKINFFNFKFCYIF